MGRLRPISGYRGESSYRFLTTHLEDRTMPHDIRSFVKFEFLRSIYRRALMALMRTDGDSRSQQSALIHH